MVGVMGIQHVEDMTLIRRAHVRSSGQKEGIGGQLLSRLRAPIAHLLLVTTLPAKAGSFSGQAQRNRSLYAPKAPSEP